MDEAGKIACLELMCQVGRARMNEAKVGGQRARAWTIISERWGGVFTNVSMRNLDLFSSKKIFILKMLTTTLIVLFFFLI